MRSFKNHLSLIVALLSILFSIQVFTIVQRAIDAYKHNLAKNYSLVVVSQINLNTKSILSANKLISTIDSISPDGVIQRLNTGFTKENTEILKLALPKFYKIKLKHYPSPQELKQVIEQLFHIKGVKKVENFDTLYNTTYKLLLLFKNVVGLFALTVVIVTVLLIFKELKIWQYKHYERMNIMGLFGAPVWLSSAVLFRLAIVDAFIASFLSFGIFTYLSLNRWVLQQLSNIGISIVIFDQMYDFLIMLGVSVSLSILLASFIVIGHKEEVT